jgi:hypothetical protein
MRLYSQLSSGVPVFHIDRTYNGDDHSLQTTQLYTNPPAWFQQEPGAGIESNLVAGK